MSEPINLLVVDLSHHETPCDLAKVKASGIQGVIWKATQGTGFVDNRYLEYRDKAADLDLLWGAYHFADNSNAYMQAEHFVKHALIGEADLFCLDWEPYDELTMHPKAAAYFVKSVEQLLKRPNECVVYGNSSFLIDQIPADLDDFFAKRRLWLAHFNTVPTIPMTWATYWLWQYAADGYGPKPNQVNGLNENPDCNSFLGSVEELRAQWACGTVSAPSNGGTYTLDIGLTISGLPQGSGVIVNSINVSSA